MDDVCAPGLESNDTPPGDDLDSFFQQLEAELTGSGSVATAAENAVPMDRRIARRCSPEEVGADLKLTVRGAADAQPINLSETGVLAETTSRLRPGTIVELLLQIDGVRRMLRATIVRSVVHSLTPKPVFRTAFRFEEPTKLPERR